MEASRYFVDLLAIQIKGLWEKNSEYKPFSLQKGQENKCTEKSNPRYDNDNEPCAPPL